MSRTDWTVPSLELHPPYSFYIETKVSDIMRCNILITVVGWFLTKLFRIQDLYVYNRNNQMINNLGGTVTASCEFAYPKHITLGKNSYINGGKIIASPNANIIIGENCLISYYVHIRTDMHIYADENVLINQQGHTEEDVIIGNDVWIGYGAQIMSGVTIADGCVIAAGAVVAKNTVPYGVYGGIPAKLIKRRTASDAAGQSSN